MSTIQRIIIIAVVAIATMITRFLPFIAFPANKETPKYIKDRYKVPRKGASGCRTWTFSGVLA